MKKMNQKKIFCENCAKLKKQLTHVEEANSYLHSIREIVVFEDLTNYALELGYNVSSITVSKDGSGKKNYELTAVCIGDQKGKKSALHLMADTYEELESKAMGNGGNSEDGEDLL